MNANNPAIHCLGLGYLPCESDNGETILVKCYYCPEVNGTILTPTDIVASNSERFSGWTMSTNYDEGLGEFQLTSRDGINHITFDSYMENNLWYHYLQIPKSLHEQSIQLASRAIMRKLTTIWPTYASKY